jgi:hypothetical protein
MHTYVCTYSVPTVGILLPVSLCEQHDTGATYVHVECTAAVSAGCWVLLVIKHTFC